MNPGNSVRIEKTVFNPKTGKSHALQNNLQGHLGDNKFMKTPNFQSMLSPRSWKTDPGARISFSPPDNINTAYPEANPETNPLMYANMATENYSNNGQIQENFDDDVPSCDKGGFSTKGAGNKPAPANYSTGDYAQEMAKIWSTEDKNSDSLPVGDMSTINALGETIQPLVYDRYIFANRHSRLRAQGDMIRGDLAIVPCKNGWFNVSVNPVVDLQEGAMNVMGGISNTTANETAQMIFNDSGNSYSTLGGVSLKQEFANPSSVFNIENTMMANNIDINSLGETGGQETIQLSTFQ
jgi:hypothetical protein